MNFLQNRDLYISDSHPDHKTLSSTFKLPAFGQWETDTAFKEVSDADLWYYFTIFSFGASTVVCTENVDNGVWCKIKAFYVADDQSWIIVAYPYSTFGSSKDSKWKFNKPRYFKHQKCKHEFTSRSIGRCFTEYTCKLCGFVNVVDSSD